MIATVNDIHEDVVSAALALFATHKYCELIDTISSHQLGVVDYNLTVDVISNNFCKGMSLTVSPHNNTNLQGICHIEFLFLKQ